MEHFFPRIQVDTYAQMHTRVKLLGGGYSQIIGGIYPHPPSPGFGTPVYNNSDNTKLKFEKCNLALAQCFRNL